MKKVLYILGELDDADIEWMVQTGTRITVPDGVTLIQEDKPLDSLYIVVSGTFSIYVKSHENREIARVGVGEVLGELSYVDERPPSATVRAAGEAAVVSIPRQELSDRLQQDQAFAARFYRALAVFLADRLRNTMGGLGFQEKTSAAKDESKDEPDLDSTSTAGARYEYILKRLNTV